MPLWDLFVWALGGLLRGFGLLVLGFLQLMGMLFVVIVRVVAVPVSCGAAAAGTVWLLGWGLGALGVENHLSGTDLIRQRLLPAAGGGVMLATLRDLQDFLPSVLKFFSEGSVEELAKAASTIAIAAGGAYLALLAFIEPTWPGPAPVHLTFTSAPLEAVVDDSKLRFFLTFDKDATCESLHQKEGNGFTISNWDIQMLSDMLPDLAKCGYTRPVRLEVVGFASSGGPDQNCATPNDFNLSVSNLRARVVGNEIESLLQQQPELRRGLQVDVRQWGRFGQMAEERDFQDRMKTYSSEMARLTRRAEIRIVDAADCSKTPSLRAEEAPAAVSAGPPGH